MQPVFYKNVVPLNKSQHGDLYIKPITSYKHARVTNSIYIACIEFIEVSREYPIVFGMGNDSVFPAVLFGLQNDQNVYIGKKGEWLAKYIPAYVRRYPFILATQPDAENSFAVCIDEDYSGFNREKNGEPLFDKNGDESVMLKQSIEFLKSYQGHIQLTDIFCREIYKAGILEPVQANIQTSKEKRVLGGFLCVNREKLKAMSADTLSDYLQKDYLELIFAHLYSLSNMNRIIE